MSRVIEPEDKPLYWEEEIVLTQIKAKLTKEVIKEALEETTNELQNYYNQYGVDFNVITDSESYINVSPKLQIIIKKKSENTTQFTLHKNKSTICEAVFIEIETESCYYAIRYNNADLGDNSIRLRYTMDKDVINKIFKQLIELN